MVATTLQNTTMNQGQVRIIDPILTNIILGYTNAELIGCRLFPKVPVAQRGGQVLQFGKEGFRKYAMRRAPGGKTARMDFGYLGNHFAMVQDSLEAVVPREYLQDAQAVVGLDLATPAVKLTWDAISLGLELDQAALATNSANYTPNNIITLGGTSLWSDYNDSNPGEQMDGYKEAVRQQVGRYPNVLILGAMVFKTLKRHPVIRAQFQYTSHDSITEVMLAEYFGVDEVVVGRAVWADDENNMSDVWGNVAILAYAPKSPSGFMEPSFGYTYTLEGNPFVEAPRWDGDSKSWLYPVENNRIPVITAPEAGFLIQTPC